MEYTIIYADPPWRQMKGGLRNTRPNQGRNLDYKVLGSNDIFEILNRFGGKVLFLWTIDKFLFDAHNIAERLGFNLHARFIWNKLNGIAPAFTVRFCHEYLLWFYKKPMLKIDNSMRGKFSTIIEERSSGHSIKPVAAYEMIESLYPNESRIELFARNKREGWDSWGDEI